MRNHDQHSLVFAQIILQPVDGIEVEIVRWLVEQQRRRAAEKRLRQQNTHFLPALQLAHLAFVQRFGNIEPVEQSRRIGLGCVAAFLADDSFEFAEPHAVRVGQLLVRLRVERVALDERLPQRRVAHDDGIDHAILVERELILPQNAELLRPRHRAFRRLHLARKNLHQRGLARAVWPADGVAPPRENVVVTSSNKIRAPKRIVMLLIESTTI